MGCLGRACFPSGSFNLVSLLELTKAEASDFRFNRWLRKSVNHRDDDIQIRKVKTTEIHSKIIERGDVLPVRFSEPSATIKAR